MTEKQYPELPEPFGWLSYNVLTRKTFFGNMPRQSLQPGVYQHIRAYSQSQVIAAIDADRAMRARETDAVTGPSGADSLKEYAKRDHVALDQAGNYFGRHMMAMTLEDLRSKSAIAGELGWRDMEIDRLKAEKVPTTQPQEAAPSQDADELDADRAQKEKK